MNNILEIKNLSVIFKKGKILKNINFFIREAEIVGIVGESGAGKTTLINAISGFIDREKFEIKGDIRILNSSENEFIDFRENENYKKNISVIPQDAINSLNPYEKIKNQLMETYFLHNKEKYRNTEEAYKYIKKILEDMNLTDVDKILNSYPNELSGGMKQRIVIILSIIGNKKILLADEPTTSLDSISQHHFMEILKSICISQKLTLIYVSHDLELLSQICKRIVFIKNGEILEEITGNNILNYLQNRDIKINFNKDNNIEKRAVLSIKNLSKIYSNGTEIKNINFDLYEGEFLALVGESGCGKTTIAKIIVNLLERTTGDIFYREKNIFQMSDFEKKLLKEKIQFLFQSSYSSLNPKLKIEDIILEGISYKKFDLSEQYKTREEYLKSLICEVGLNTNILNKYPHQLSGGERQRVGIARVLAVRPEIIIADESFTALDMQIKYQILELFMEIKKKRNLSCIFISHDLHLVKKFSDRVLIMKSGTIIEEGETKTVFSNPKKEYTKELLAYCF